MNPKEIPYIPVLSDRGNPAFSTSDGFTPADQNHVNDDVDSSHMAHHHSIGLSENQVNSGLHTHDGINSRLIPFVTDVELKTGDQSNVTWTGSVANPALGNGTLAIEWEVFGPFVIFNLKVTFGTTTTVGNGTYGFTLPFIVNGGLGSVVSGYIKNGAAPNFFPVTAFVSSVSDKIFSIIPSSAQAAGSALLGNAGHKAAWANGDEIFISGVVLGGS